MISVCAFDFKSLVALAADILRTPNQTKTRAGREPLLFSRLVMKLPTTDRGSQGGGGLWR